MHASLLFLSSVLGWRRIKPIQRANLPAWVDDVHTLARTPRTDPRARQPWRGADERHVRAKLGVPSRRVAWPTSPCPSGICWSQPRSQSGHWAWRADGRVAANSPENWLSLACTIILSPRHVVAAVSLGSIICRPELTLRFDGTMSGWRHHVGESEPGSGPGKILPS